MTENDIFIIRMNIARYRAMLQFTMDAGKRSMVERLLAEAEENLATAPDDQKRS